MTYARVLAPIAFVAALAACSGNIGGGQSTLPGGAVSPMAQIQQPVPTSTPLSASNIASLSETPLGPQPLPTVAGYGGTVAFPKPAATPSSTPNPKASATGAPGPIAIGVTAAIVEPTDAPKFTQTGGKRSLLGKKTDSSAPKPLLFITLLSTADVTLDAYPRFAIDVPRDVVTKYREGSFGLALFDPADKAKRYRMAVAERDYATPEAAASAAATRAPTPAPRLPTPAATGSGQPGSFTPPPLATAAPTPTLPPQRIAFSGTAAVLALKANRAVVFALYAIPPQPTPSPAASAAPSAAPSAAASSAASSAPSRAPSPAGT
ncbi:MAG: hypothetical protein ABR591_09365 [Candidatus Velthaea sp.]